MALMSLDLVLNVSESATFRNVGSLLFMSFVTHSWTHHQLLTGSNLWSECYQCFEHTPSEAEVGLLAVV